VILLLVWLKRGTVRWRHIAPTLPMFALGLLAGLITWWVEKHHVRAEGEVWSQTPIERCLIAGRVVWFYLGKLVWPAKLTFVYPRWTIDSGVWWQYAFPIAAVGVVVALWLLRRRIGRGPLVAILAFGGTLVPAMGFFKVYFMQYSYVADHFQYLASVAVIALFAALLTKVLRIEHPQGGRPMLRLVPVGLILVVLATLTWRQSRVYTDLESLWHDVLAKNPNAWMAYNNLGQFMQDRGDLDAAYRHYAEAVRLNPDHWLLHFNLGQVRTAQKRLEEAAEHYSEALRHRQTVALVHNNLAAALAKLGRYDEAVEHFTEAIEIRPDYTLARRRFGHLLEHLGRLDEAINQYRLALEDQPLSAETSYRLASALSRAGQFDEAIEYYRRALQLNANHKKARQELEAALARQREAASEPPGPARR
jgi:tetratricopeptide (TPR) repeat protein